MSGELINKIFSVIGHKYNNPFHDSKIKRCTLNAEPSIRQNQRKMVQLLATIPTNLQSLNLDPSPPLQFPTFAKSSP